MRGTDNWIFTNFSNSIGSGWFKNNLIGAMWRL